MVVQLYLQNQGDSPKNQVEMAPQMKSKAQNNQNLPQKNIMI